MYCSNKEQDDDLALLASTSKMSEAKALYDKFLDYPELKEIADEILCAKIKIALRRPDLSLKQLIWLFEITPCRGCMVRNDILTALAKRAQNESSVKLAQLCKSAPPACKSVLLSVQGESY
jgi:hypothetical protein